jgi:hypothetical protein
LAEKVLTAYLQPRLESCRPRPPGVLPRHVPHDNTSASLKNTHDQAWTKRAAGTRRGKPPAAGIPGQLDRALGHKYCTYQISHKVY